MSVDVYYFRLAFSRCVGRSQIWIFIAARAGQIIVEVNPGKLALHTVMVVQSHRLRMIQWLDSQSKCNTGMLRSCDGQTL